MVKEALETSIKVWKLASGEEIMAKHFSKIPSCLINIMSYINTKKKITSKEHAILINCLKSYELLFKADSINKLVSTDIFFIFLRQVYL